MIKVLADKYLYKIEDFLPDEIDLTLFDPQQPLKKIPCGTQALLIRTTTKLNSETYQNLPPSLEFAATASAGTDHVDIPWLQSRDITFAGAAGCNARAVAEYVATTLLIWVDMRSIDLSVGIIGAGHTGSAVQKILTALGIHTVAYDPPREEREPAFQSASLNEVLSCDILTFHTPLTFEGNYPTYHWLHEEKLENKHYKLIINAARGGVVDEMALLKAFKNKHLDKYILDVWENEPVFDDEIAKNAFIKTPHIAGYSIQAKHNASAIIAKSFCEYFNKKLPMVPFPKKNEQIDVPSSIFSLAGLLYFLHPVGEYDQMFSKLIGKIPQRKKTGFGKIRTSHPLRYEYGSLHLAEEFIEQPNLLPLRSLFNV